MANNDGGPAFPAAFDNYTDGNIMVGGKVIPPGSRAECLGMSVRDYFAAKAMDVMARDWALEDGDQEAYVAFACDCYRMADAMLKAREA